MQVQGVAPSSKWHHSSFNQGHEEPNESLLFRELFEKMQWKSGIHDSTLAEAAVTVSKDSIESGSVHTSVNLASKL